MKDRLYLNDSYLREFEANIVETSTISGHPAVRLDRTLFYPTSGGQMHDKGYLNDAAVLEVFLTDDVIWHSLDRPLNIGRVHGVLDWERRFDYMQQHTGFHILAASFLNELGIDTLSSHLGEEFSTIDVDRATVDQAELDRVEILANKIIWENRTINAFYVDKENIDNKKLRQPPDVEGPIRLVEVLDFDLDPCGGTHVRQTAEVGLVKLTGREKIRGYTRFSFIAGSRALREFRRYSYVLSKLSQILTTGPEEMPDAVLKIITEQKALKKELNTQGRRIAEQYLSEICEQAKRSNLVVRNFSGLGMDNLRWLASSAVKSQPGIYLLGSSDAKASLVFACSDCGMDLRPIFKAVLPLIDGKGGGDATFVQGGGGNAAGVEGALQRAAELLKKK